MTAIQKLFLVLPSLEAVGPQLPYVRLRTSDQTVVADVEYRAEDGDGERLQVAVIDRAGATGAGPQAVVAGVFDLSSGALLRVGPTVSTATAPADPAGALAELLACIDGLQAESEAQGR